MALKRGAPNEKGWSELEVIEDQKHLGATFPKKSTPLILLHHLSDLHVCDAQSPIRPEFLDRWADPDSPIRDLVGTIGCYRPHAMLSPHVVEAMVQSLNKVTRGPLSGHPITCAIITGDTTDNAQVNEVDWYLALLDGVVVRPDSGSFDKYEGVIDDGSEHYDVKYWHPHGTPPGKEDDQARELYGFPIVPRLLDSCRKPFNATGLHVPWFGVHGNHDSLLQGTVTPTAITQAAMIGDRRFESLPSTITLAETLASFMEVGPALYPDAGDSKFVSVTPDLQRRAVERGEYAAKHLASPGLPKGHGFTDDNVINKHMYYSVTVNEVKLIVLDSVNEYGGWQGSLDLKQFEWLESEIKSATKPVLLASHHPLATMFNGYNGGSSENRRVCREEIEEMLIKYPAVIAWLAGHEHRHHVRWVGPKVEEIGFWHIETASHADWPEQSRTVEIVRGEDSGIYIGLTLVDHAGGPSYGKAESTLEMASLSRLLSANVWQKREGLGAKRSEDWALGEPHERNTVLKIVGRFLFDENRFSVH